MAHRKAGRRAAGFAAGPEAGDGGWITVSGHGSGFHDCPLCRELARNAEGTEGVEASVWIRPESLPLIEGAGWLDELVDLVGPNATVRVMGRDMAAEPVEELSLATFLARMGYE